ncbi:HypC/HybG/HupF family hydrogenase formation chaperone [Streptacidiphilus melanogenes]|nr:HypC/HybG/HupF family hydrogenase formation chaperone [Streptacidiphilus melanogenes]
MTHDRHGLGRVVAVEDDTSVIVDFGTTHRRINTPFTAMTKL